MADADRLHPYPFDRRRRRHQAAARPRARPRRAHHRARQQRLLRRRRVPPRDPRLHGAGRRSDRHRHHGSDLPNLKAEFSARAAQARRRLDGARARTRTAPTASSSSCIEDSPLPRRPVHRLGRGRERHGTCRCASRRRAAARAGQDRQGDGVEGQLSEESRARHRRLGRARRRVRAAAVEARAPAGARRAAQGAARASWRRSSAMPARSRSICRRRMPRPS